MLLHLQFEDQRFGLVIPLLDGRLLVLQIVECPALGRKRQSDACDGQDDQGRPAEVDGRVPVRHSRQIAPP